MSFVNQSEKTKGLYFIKNDKKIKKQMKFG